MREPPTQRAAVKAPDRSSTEQQDTVASDRGNASGIELLQRAADRSLGVLQLNGLQRATSLGVVQRWPIFPPKKNGDERIDRAVRHQLTFMDFMRFRVASSGFRNWIDNVFFKHFLEDLPPQDLLGLMEVGVRQAMSMREVEFWMAKFKSYRSSLSKPRQKTLPDILRRVRSSGLRFVRFEDLIAHIRKEMGFQKAGMQSSGDSEPPIPIFWITGINTRRGEKGHFKGKKGDHTSAHVLFRKWLTSTFRGLSFGSITATALDLLAELDSLFSEVYDSHADEALERGISDAWSEARSAFFDALDKWEGCFAEFSKLHFAGKFSVPAEMAFLNLCVALMNLRNSLPYAAMEFGGTGGSEGYASKGIQELDDMFRKGIKVDGIPLVRLTIATDWEKFMQNTLKLVDLERTHAELSFGDESLDLELVPGRTGDYETDINNIVFLHLESIRMAYPSLWAGLQAMGLLQRFRNSIRSRILDVSGDEYIPDADDGEEGYAYEADQKRQKR
ncbi:hypothetical protein [uncultured Roseobacter sp.]|uniref:hypothetical protein n=1 Tax=uncultured Roseobacter sp. TaxID=114847 RepID=UPI00261E1451|nr:hypothetical protein [uncultured Roseobacter sp.]